MSQPFLLGAATAPYQVEGNNVNSDYWKMEHVKHSDFIEKSGEACDHYHRYKEDLALLAGSGCNAYRFGIEWARIEPEEGHIDRQALSHYRDVLLCCHSLGLTPVVTLHHFSSPTWLIGQGGWAKPYVVTAFARYARIVAEELGDLMTYVCTINEANMGFQLGKIAQDMMKSKGKKEGDVQVGTNSSLSLKTILLGMLEQGRVFHVSPFAVNTFLKPRNQAAEKIVMAAHRAAKAEIRRVAPDLRIGLTLSLFDYQPLPGGEERAAQLWQEDFGFYLPFFRDDDFLGVQNYTRKIIDTKGAQEIAPDAALTQMGYETYPEALGHVLTKVAEDFHGDLIVTENGIATADDAARCVFIQKAIAGLRDAQSRGVSVRGYLHWSLLDNFEWQAGYAKTFGLIAVDRRTQTRYPKESLSTLGAFARA
ncbi:MAG: family 1 glycosylhydrolase [Clostridia bacterium]|nr:family 1 glycosylhydrolase [Clostridia bacterium]